ncbi:hypothetical protein FACS1894166_03290 [Bacilli bacterium]|nr:hypothetical protein FACS1894166_03290 [Bacilli bacterium]
MASVAVAIALPMKYVNRPGSQPTINDTITVETDKASLSSVGDTALVSANSSDGRKVTLSCKIDGIEDTTNYFNPDEGIVTYKDKEVSGKTITITASDGVATNQITKIDFNTLEDIITFIGGYSPSLALVNAYTMVSAESTQNYPITLSATIDSVPVMDTDVFNPADGKVTYKDNTFANKTIVIKASDGMASVEPTINIGFGAIPTPDVHYKAHWDSTSGGALEYGVQASATLSLTVYGEDTPITTGVTYD